MSISGIGATPTPAPHHKKQTVKQAPTEKPASNPSQVPVNSSPSPKPAQVTTQKDTQGDNKAAQLGAGSYLIQKNQTGANSGAQVAKALQENADGKNTLLQTGSGLQGNHTGENSAALIGSGTQFNQHGANTLQDAGVGGQANFNGDNRASKVGNLTQSTTVGANKANNIGIAAQDTHSGENVLWSAGQGSQSNVDGTNTAVGVTQVKQTNQHGDNVAFGGAPGQGAIGAAQGAVGAAVGAAAAAYSGDALNTSLASAAAGQAALAAGSIEGAISGAEGSVAGVSGSIAGALSGAIGAAAGSSGVVAGIIGSPEGVQKGLQGAQAGFKGAQAGFYGDKNGASEGVNKALLAGGEALQAPQTSLTQAGLKPGADKANPFVSPNVTQEQTQVAQTNNGVVNKPDPVDVFVVDDFNPDLKNPGQQNQNGEGFNHGETVSSIIQKGGNQPNLEAKVKIKVHDVNVNVGNDSNRTQVIADALGKIATRAKQDPNSVDAVNLSQEQSSQTPQSKKVQEQIDQLTTLGIPVVVAADNFGPDKPNQLAPDSAVTVASADENNHLNNDSGPGDIVAVGRSTSFAAPQVTAIAGYEKQHGFTPAQIEADLKNKQAENGGVLPGTTFDDVYTAAPTVSPFSTTGGSTVAGPTTDKANPFVRSNVPQEQTQVTTEAPLPTGADQPPIGANQPTINTPQFANDEQTLTDGSSKFTTFTTPVTNSPSVAQLPSVVQASNGGNNKAMGYYSVAQTNTNGKNIAKNNAGPVTITGSNNEVRAQANTGVVTIDGNSNRARLVNNDQVNLGGADNTFNSNNSALSTETITGLNGGSGNTGVITGGSNSDTVIVSAGDHNNYLFNGGAGDDSIDLNGTIQDWKITSNDQGKTFIAVNGTDTVIFSDVESINIGGVKVPVSEFVPAVPAETPTPVNQGDFAIL